MRGTVNDLSPTEDASAWELSNITVPDSLKDASQIDCFGEHQQEHIVEAPAEVFHAGIVPHKGEEVMEELPPDGENMGSDNSEESDSDEGTPRCHHTDSINQAEEGEDGEELTEESAEELMEEPAEGLAEELTGEPTAGPTEGPAEETIVEYLTLE